MAKKLREKPVPEIVNNLRLQEMAYGGEVVARLPETAPAASPAGTLTAGPDTRQEGQEEGDFQPGHEPVETELVPPVTVPGSQVVFVTGGLPGELVEVQLYRRKKSFIKANVRRVDEASPDRAAAPCPYFGVDKWPNCGGCQWQHANYEAQLNYKHNILRDQLIRLGGFVDQEPPLLPPLAAVSPWGYRNNVEFQVDENEGRPCFHRQNSIRLVPVQSCHIAHPLITLVIDPLTAALQKHLPKRVHQVTIRVGAVSGDAPISAEEITALASYSDNPAAKLAALDRFLAVTPLEMSLQKPRPTMLLVLRMLREWQKSDLQPFLEELQATMDRYVELTVIGEGRKRRLEDLGGPPYLTEVLDGVTYRIPPLAFFQSNSPMAVELIREAMGAFDEAGLNLRGKKLLDIYCGVGTFALQMARRGATVLGIEEYAGAVEGAGENARLNGLEDRCRFVAAKAEEHILELEAAGDRYDGALVDPPRRGCDPALLQSLLKTRPPVLVYVSCDPSTLARDLKILSEGYELVRCRAVDMFPQTYHMESVSLLRAK
ncbi:MAG: hypothetical protein JWP00_1764 [Chloroflexi bacterium]|nr:hypothetical protein [Chloroflexota bacterium]